MNPIIAKYLALSSIAGAIIALIFLVVAPLGWRLGVWHFRTAFYRLMAVSGYLAGGSALASVLALVLAWNVLEAREIAGARSSDLGASLPDRDPFDSSFEE